MILPYEDEIGAIRFDALMYAIELGSIAGNPYILWSELGTREDYQSEYYDKPLGELVREIVGLDMNAAKEAFAQYLNDVNLDDRQIYFVNQIINYIVQNGMMKDFSVMQESPFTDRGELGDVFTDTVVWLGVFKVIKSINANAIAA